MGKERRNVKMEMVGKKDLKFRKLKRKVHVGSEAAHSSSRLNAERCNRRKYWEERESVYKMKHRKMV